ncbi:MAG: hypothetical protein NTU49_07605 [Gammaproteobacteria bacterium]|nr:hypothetical protein [Gammaproteobacteria bacterium]
MRPIHEIMQYKNEYVFKRYEREFPANKISAEQAFHGIVQYLWLCQKHRIDRKKRPGDDSLNFVCSMYPEMREIDDMWHTFLMFTKDYADFCEQYFGEFVHHTPKTGDEKYDSEFFKTEFTRYISYVYDNLGEETVAKWFAEFVD